MQNILSSLDTGTYRWNVSQAISCTSDEYWQDPFHWGLEAERELRADGVVTIFEPVARGTYHCVDGRVLAERNAYTVECVLAYIADLPEPGALAAEFDDGRAYVDFLYQARQAQRGELLWMAVQESHCNPM